jgi:signal transduction histidine kinase
LALRYLSVFVAVLLVASLFHSYGVLNRVLGGSPAEVHGHIATIGGGDFSGGIRVPAGRENSVLGWLEETRQQLTLIEVQKRQAEASLREEEAKLRSLFTLSPLGIVLTDLDGRLIDGNGAFRRICGGDPAGGGALFGEDGGRLSAMLQSAGRYGPYERDHTRPDGSVVQLRLNGTLVTAADGRPYVWSIVEDISERRAYEEQLARSNTELEQFAYVASHDLQSPLRNIISFSQMLQRRYQGQLDEDAQEFIGFIIDNGKRMSSLISDLLQFSRVVHQGAAPTPMAAQQALEMALTSMERVILDTGATISAEPLPMVMGDPTQLASVFQNLIGNALKYRHPQRPPMVAVAVAALGDQYRFTIRDNGIGIAPAYHDKVFEMFERLEPNAYPEGSGIGLAICRRIIHRLGGTIGVESSSPEGTTFFFTLNAVPDHAAVGKDLETAV